MQTRRLFLNRGPLPEKTPLNAVLHGKVKRAAIDGVSGNADVKRIGFTVEKVYFESMPDRAFSRSKLRPSF